MDQGRGAEHGAAEMVRSRPREVGKVSTAICGGTGRRPGCLGAIAGAGAARAGHASVQQPRRGAQQRRGAESVSRSQAKVRPENAPRGPSAPRMPRGNSADRYAMSHSTLIRNKEKRGQARYDLNAKVRILWQDETNQEHVVSAALLNVSASGIKLRLDHRLPRGAYVICND